VATEPWAEVASTTVALGATMGLSARVRTYLARDAFMLKGAEQMRISNFGYALGFFGASGENAIYQTTGAGGKIVHETPLDSGGGDIVEFWIQGSTVIGPNALEPRSKYDIGSVGFYKYPAGGEPTKTLMKGFGATGLRD
jgi:hypothetical protein